MPQHHGENDCHPKEQHAVDGRVGDGGGDENADNGHKRQGKSEVDM